MREAEKLLEPELQASVITSKGWRLLRVTGKAEGEPRRQKCHEKCVVDRKVLENVTQTNKKPARDEQLLTLLC